jgi:hypothetical protein
VFGHAILEREKNYVVGDIAYCTEAPSWVRLRCTTAGKTSVSQPSNYSTITQAGTTITDGTAKFVVDDVRLAQTLSTSANQAPSVAVLKNAYDTAVSTAANNNKTNLYVGSDGKLHFVNKAGADTALNFKTHDATYTYPLNSLGSLVDLGVRHTYRYVNAQNVYQKGYVDGITKANTNKKATVTNTTNASGKIIKQVFKFA